MDVYRDSLLRESRAGDPFRISCWPGLGTCSQKGSKFKKAWSRYLSYPVKVARTKSVELAHVLDHSVADLGRWLPRSVPKVVTLHDLIPLRFSGGLTPGQVERFRGRVKQLATYDKIVSVSEYSKREAVDLLQIDPEKIVVIPNGVKAPPSEVGSCSATEVLREEGADAVVLSIGSIQERKNLRILPEALKNCRRQTGKRIGLHRIGAKLPEELARDIRKILGEEFLIESGRVGEAQLDAAYGASDIVVVPSLYEGFGLPVLEAFAFGVPVACGNTTSLPEVGGDEAYYFSPDSGEEAGEAFSLALEAAGDTESRRRRIARAEEYSWRRHLEGLFRVYEEILGG